MGITTGSHAGIPHIATGLLFDRNGKLLVYLRDDKPSIPFPNHWDLFGGFVEEGESPEEALVREVEEELGWHLETFEFFKDYYVETGDVRPNIKHVYAARLSVEPENLRLCEGQRLMSIPLAEHSSLPFANILASIVNEFALSPMSDKYAQRLT
jgi:8-oxo-dGTP diphosphatase